MKRVLSVIAIAVVLIVSPVSVSAHPGDTDLNGGHYNWETGDYHYHHGHPAHYHTDGVCPYGDYEQYTDVGSETRYDRLSKLASLLIYQRLSTGICQRAGKCRIYRWLSGRRSSRLSDWNRRRKKKALPILSSRDLFHINYSRYRYSFSDRKPPKD